jgi:hypothetical protein
MASLLFGIFSIASTTAENPASILPLIGTWRPPTWNQPAVTAITVPAPAPDPNSGKALDPEVLVFDAILRAEHAEENRITDFPIQGSQSGAFVSDHVINLPSRLTLDIGMSDAMDSYYPGQWSSNPSKSVSAYQKLLDLKEAGQILSVTTRLKNFPSMVIESIQTSDTNRTLHGLRAIVTFRQIQIATIAAVSSTVSFNSDDQSGANPVSARPQDTQATPVGALQPNLPSPAIVAQHQVTGQTTTVPYAGSWSSNTVLGLPELPPPPG